MLKPYTIELGRGDINKLINALDVYAYALTEKYKDNTNYLTEILVKLTVLRNKLVNLIKEQV
jgi:hypothetical protein